MRSIRLAVGLAGVLLVGGCGDDGGEPLTKAGFVTRANAICAKTQEAVDEGAQAAFPNKGNVPTFQELERFVDGTLVPQVRRELDELGELKPPKDDKEQVRTILEAGREGLDEVSTNAGIILDKERNPLNSYADMAEAYGLKACGRNSDETARALAGLK